MNPLLYLLQNLPRLPHLLRCRSPCRLRQPEADGRLRRRAIPRHRLGAHSAAPPLPDIPGTRLPRARVGGRSTTPSDGPDGPEGVLRSLHQAGGSHRRGLLLLQQVREAQESKEEVGHLEGAANLGKFLSSGMRAGCSFENGLYLKWMLLLISRCHSNAILCLHIRRKEKKDYCHL